MLRSRVYREQVATFRQLFAEFPNEAADVRDAFVRGHLIKLSGLLQAHFRLEEQQIYPDLLRTADPVMRGLVRDFREDLEPVAEEFELFYTVWTQPGACMDDPALFLNEWNTLQLALNARLDREERELFMAYDRVRSEQEIPIPS